MLNTNINTTECEVKSTTSPSSASPFSWDDDDISDSESKVKSSSGCCGWLYRGWLAKIPSWIRSIMASTIGTSLVHHLYDLFEVCFLILIPGVVDYIVYSVNSKETIFRIPKSGYIEIGSFSLIIWCFFICSNIIVFNLVRFAVLIAPTAFGWLTKLLFGNTPKNFDIYAGYISDLRRYISIFVYMVILTVVWHVLYRPDIYENDPTQGWRMIVFKVIACGLAASFFFLIQKLLIQIIAVRFHRTAYLDRLKQASITTDAIANLNIISKKILRKRAQTHALEEALKKQKSKNIKLRTGYVQKQSFDDIDILVGAQTTELALAKNHKRSASADNVGIPQKNEQENNDQVKLNVISNETLNENTVMSTQSDLNLAKVVSDVMASNNDFNSASMKSPSNDQLSGDTKRRKGLLFFKKWDLSSSGNGSSGSNNSLNKQPSKKFLKLAKQIAKGFELNSTQEAKRVARRIYEALSPDPQELIRMKNNPESVPNPPRICEELVLDDFLPHYKSRFEAEKVMKIFDKDENGSVTRQELKEAILWLYKERKSLSLSLRDVSSAVGKLDIMMFFITVILTIFSCLLIFGVSLGSFVVTSLSLILAVTFMIGNTASTMFEGIIFLFVTHPFDVGDRVFVDGQNLIVKELGILTTVFTRWDGQLIYSPNSVLSTKEITNVRRSPNQLEVCELHVAFDTPMEKLNLLKKRMAEFVARENLQYIPRMELHPFEIESMNKLKLQIFIEHRHNWQDAERRWNNRNRFLLLLKETLTELEITYKKLPERVQITKTVTLSGQNKIV